jgi:acetate kinase
MKNVLVINAGSSSIKYQLIDMDNETVIAKGIVERIGIDGSVIKHKPTGKTPVQIEKPIKTHMDGIQMMIALLTDQECGVIEDLSSIKAVGHRVLHGGADFACSVLIDGSDGKVMEAIRDNVELGPLHNPANIMGIEACEKAMPGIPMVAVFDTAFHATMPKKAFLYGVPYEMYEKYRIRRYGFHGTSHRYVSKRAAEMLGRPEKELKIITCHLGNGSSVAAVKDGVCVDTSMGYTPQEGLVMGTRAGDMDTSIIPYLMKKLDMTPDEATAYINKKCGVLGISGISSDFRDLWDEADKGNERAKLALDVFSYRLKKYIGAYAAAMGGVDVIAFTGGIGENDGPVRADACEGLEYMGVKIDTEYNYPLRGKEATISTPDSKVTVMIVPTNEELVIARDTVELGLS